MEVEKRSVAVIKSETRISKIQLCGIEVVIYSVGGLFYYPTAYVNQLAYEARCRLA